MPDEPKSRQSTGKKAKKLKKVATRNQATCTDSVTDPSLVVNAFSCACVAGFANGMCDRLHDGRRLRLLRDLVQLGVF
jgi:hypothetical protein|tara:strand:- start:1520 stop:1753 length:234 start_codon:yes stop_codon:yes gene_type:complete